MLAARNIDALPFLNRYTLLGLTALFFYLLHLGVKAFDDTSGLVKLQVLMVVQIAPFIVAVTRKHFNYIAFILFNHFVSYSIAKYSALTNLKRFSENSDFHGAVRELIVCTILMTIGYHVGRLVLFRDVSERQRFVPLSLKRWQLWAVGMYVATFPLTQDYMPFGLNIIHFAACSAHTLLLLSSRAPGYERESLLIKLLIPFSCIYYFLKSGHLTMFGQFAAFAFITTCLQRRYKNFVLIFLMTALVSAIQTVKPPFRYFIQHEGVNSGIGVRMDALLGLLKAKYIDNSLDDMEEEKENDEEMEDDDESSKVASLMEGFDRIGDESFERVLSMTPRVHPHWQGETYDSIPYMFIPRALWPDKPSRQFWNRFGRMYRFLGEDDYHTAVGVSFIAEAYLNYGFTFMYVMCILFGMFAATIERLSIALLHGYYYFPYVVLLMPIVSYSADLGTILNSTMILVVGIFLCRRPLLRLAQRDDYS